MSAVEKNPIEFFSTVPTISIPVCPLFQSFRQRGDVIAAVSSTGSGTGPRLCLEIMLNGEYLNPYDFVNTG